MWKKHKGVTMEAIGVAGVVGVIFFTLIGVVIGALYALHTSTGQKQ